MDVHATRKVRGFLVIIPVVVGEPCVRGRHSGHFRQAFLCGGVQVGQVCFPDFIHTGCDGEEFCYFMGDGGIIDVDEGGLVVCYGKGAGGSAVQHFLVFFRFDGNPATFAEDAVEGDVTGDVGNAVFAQDNGNDACCLQILNQVAQQIIQRLGCLCRLWGGGAEFLKVIIQIRQVDEVQRGFVLALYPFGGVSNPLCCAYAGHRSPEGREWKFSQILFNGFPEVHRLGVDVKDFAAVSRVHGARCDGPIGGGIHVIPPEEFGAGEVRAVESAQCFPDARALNEFVGLFPELNFAHAFVVPAVAGDGVLFRRKSSDVGALCRAGYCRESGGK